MRERVELHCKFTQVQYFVNQVDFGNGRVTDQLNQFDAVMDDGRWKEENRFTRDWFLTTKFSFR